MMSVDVGEGWYFVAEDIHGLLTTGSGCERLTGWGLDERVDTAVPDCKRKC